MMKKITHWGAVLLVSFVLTFQTVVLIFNVTHPELTTMQALKHGWESLQELTAPHPVIGETLKKLKDVVD